MAVEAKKKKSCNSVNSDCGQNNRKISFKVSESNEKNDHGKKRVHPTDNQNDTIELTVNQTDRLSHVKPVINNLVIHSVDSALGFANSSVVSKFHKDIIINQFKRFQLSKIVCPFDRRVTAVSWHPKYPKIFAAGSKGGDILLHNLNGTDDHFSHGIGVGGSILALKFDYDEPYRIYTASLTGKVCSENFQENKSDVLFSFPMCWNNWFTSFDVCKNRKCMLTGDCKGSAYFHSTSGEPIWQRKQLHTSKITHIEFNVHDPDILVTSSNDHTVKLWDLRAISSSEKKQSCLAEFPHLKAVNSANFSPSNGINLLTTDQYNELRIYSGPLWNEMIKIIHPHRQFQHITYMKAIWHPLEDIVIVGRYPDDKVKKEDSRTIDFYDGSNGQLLHQILSPTDNIVSLNAMNSTAEDLATAAGCSIAFLKDSQVLNANKLKSDEDEDIEGTTSDFNRNLRKSKVTKVAKRARYERNVSSKKKSE